MSLDRTATKETVPGPARAARASGPLGFARMTGSSIAARDAAPWITDFLNAAFYRRPIADREVDDLRLAFAIVTTYWYRKDPKRRLRMADLSAFHRAFGSSRFDTVRSGRGALCREELLDGASRLIGDWFPDAYADDARRGWGIAFPTVVDRAAYDPAHRLALARLGRLTPESAPPASSGASRRFATAGCSVRPSRSRLRRGRSPGGRCSPADT